MLEFMDYIQHAFSTQSKWNTENSYSSLTATAKALLDFDTPLGLRLNLSSLSSPNFATSYNLGSIGLVAGSLSYLYSSLPLTPPSSSGSIDLHSIIRGYRQIQEFPRPDLPFHWEEWHGGRRVDFKPTLLYGRLYLPDGTLEGLYLRRISPTSQVRITGVSDSRLRNGGTLLAMHQRDVGKYNHETLFSTDGGLLGFRGLYNFGPDPRKVAVQAAVVDGKGDRKEEKFSGRFSAGAELYYGTLNKSGGVSIGGRFATLPEHKGIPLTATLTLNPLMGNLSATYAVKASRDLSLCTRFDFNAYSYESAFDVGCELWRYKNKPIVRKQRTTEAKLAWRLDGDEGTIVRQAEEIAGVLKAKVDREGRIGVLWEGRVKEVLFCLGGRFDLGKREQPFRSLGLELQFSS